MRLDPANGAEAEAFLLQRIAAACDDGSLRGSFPSVGTMHQFERLVAWVLRPFEACAACLFLTDASNRPVFFGRVVPSAADYQELRKSIAWVFAVTLLAGLWLVQIAAPSWLLLMLGIAFGVGCGLCVQRVGADWERSDRPVSAQQLFDNLAKHFSPLFVWFMFVCSAVVTLRGLLTHGLDDARVVGICFFGFSAILFAWILRAQRRLRSASLR
jgi:hypothetical protein